MPRRIACTLVYKSLLFKRCRLTRSKFVNVKFWQIHIVLSLAEKRILNNNRREVANYIVFFDVI